MSKLCILQSYDDSRMTSWLQVCRDSVRQWADLHGYSYHFIGDELFEDVPAWYLEKAAGRLPIAADLGRLQWQQRLLADFDVVVWLDVDVLVFAPQLLIVELYQRDCVFGRESWLQQDVSKAGRFTTYRNVHNAYMGFAKSSTTLPFLIDTVLDMMRRVDPQHIAPQFVGPKLLSSLHNTVGFALEPRVGALSDVFRDALLHDNQKPLQVFSQRCQATVAAANLCATLATSASEMDAYVQRLLTFSSGIGPSTFT